MSLALELVNVLSYAAIGLIIGIIANSRNSIGLMNAVGDLFQKTFGAAASTIR